MKRHFRWRRLPAVSNLRLALIIFIFAFSLCPFAHALENKCEAFYNPTYLERTMAARNIDTQRLRFDFQFGFDKVGKAFPTQMNVFYDGKEVLELDFLMDHPKQYYWPSTKPIADGFRGRRIGFISYLVAAWVVQTQTGFHFSSNLFGMRNGPTDQIDLSREAKTLWRSMVEKKFAFFGNRSMMDGNYEFDHKIFDDAKLTSDLGKLNIRRLPFVRSGVSHLDPDEAIARMIASGEIRHEKREEYDIQFGIGKFDVFTGPKNHKLVVRKYQSSPTIIFLITNLDKKYPVKLAAAILRKLITENAGKTKINTVYIQPDKNNVESLSLTAKVLKYLKEEGTYEMDLKSEFTGTLRP